MPLAARSAKSAKAGACPRELAARLAKTRALSLEIAEPLTAEDQAVQAHDDASPAKWHLAHTTWFFEELVLKAFLPGYRVFDERFAYLFNSYYESLGPRHPRPRRGLLTRPPADDVCAYRDYADERLQALLAGGAPEEALELIELGIHHEQQHQELMLTDVLALFAANPLRPVYRSAAPSPVETPAPGEWRNIGGGIYRIGHSGESFAYDNEGPAHEVLLRDFRMFSREVTNGEWIAFVEEGGYSNPSLWLSDGWAAVQREGWAAPGYWEEQGGAWHQMTLHGLLPVRPGQPVTHISYYEADAFARWAGYRLPTEFEWEAAAGRDAEPSPFDSHRLVAAPASPKGASTLLGNLWQWTQSAYQPYPGYRPPRGPLGEYNGKFMCNQLVLRGGSFATPDGHVRPTYRNFFYPQQRWQFMGLRLASDA
jgi:ergothioneine biosynthesis protein EgtB